MYNHVEEISQDILEKIPESPLTLKQAQDIFKTEFLKKALLENNNNITSTAKKISLRYETLQRKIKALQIEINKE